MPIKFLKEMVINTLVYGNYNYGINSRTRNSITEDIKEDFPFSAYIGASYFLLGTAISIISSDYQS